MTMTFPGMDPYLEAPAVFPGIHGRMVVYTADSLSEVIQPRYIASVGERVYVQSRKDSAPEHAIVPDVWMTQTKSGRSVQAGGNESATAVLEAEEPVLVEMSEPEVRETFIEILDRESGMKVVTVIEIISPTNKYAGTGRETYLRKQFETLHSDTHLVEIDLLRRGPHVLGVSEVAIAGKYDYDYLMCVHRAGQFVYEVYPTTLRQKLPRIRIPLAGDDPDIRLDIRAALGKAYDAGGYRHRIDYSKPCLPPLTPDDQKWANERIKSAPTEA